MAGMSADFCALAIHTHSFSWSVWTEGLASAPPLRTLPRGCPIAGNAFLFESVLDLMQSSE
eukprot:2245251-Amphidinium_carterae.1